MYIKQHFAGCQVAYFDYCLSYCFKAIYCIFMFVISEISDQMHKSRQACLSGYGVDEKLFNL